MPRRKKSEETREAFISAALELCREGGPEAVSARRLGRILGLSQMAVYRHFQDMEDLLAHAWDRAFAELINTINAVLGRENAKEDFRSGLRAYVRWGIQNPGLYRLMFFVYFERLEVLQEQVSSLRGLTILRDVIQGTLQGLGISVPDSDELHSMTLQAWFTVHGLTTVAISGRFHRVSDQSPDHEAGRIIDRMCDQFVALMQKRSGPAASSSSLAGGGRHMGDTP